LVELRRSEPPLALDAPPAPAGNAVEQAERRVAHGDDAEADLSPRRPLDDVGQVGEVDDERRARTVRHLCPERPEGTDRADGAGQAAGAHGLLAGDAEFPWIRLVH